jgi:excisionase family DNA binding protein
MIDDSKPAVRPNVDADERAAAAPTEAARTAETAAPNVKDGPPAGTGPRWSDLAAVAFQLQNLASEARRLARLKVADRTASALATLIDGLQRQAAAVAGVHQSVDDKKVWYAQEQGMNPTDDFYRKKMVELGTVDVPEACRLTGLGRTYLYSLMERKILRYCKVGKRRLIPRAEITRLLAEALVGG